MSERKPIADILFALENGKIIAVYDPKKPVNELIDDENCLQVIHES